MATFYSVLGFMAVNGFKYSDPGSFDMITSLPLEMTIMILRLLSGKDLLNAACVSKKWFDICKSDRKLRHKIRRYLRQQRRALILARMGVTSARNVPNHFSNRPAMTNIVNANNTADAARHRLPVEPSTSRYMPYRRQATVDVATARASSSRRRNINVEEITSSRFRLRM